MTSPVDTTVKWARSTMPGAPVLTRAAGSLISLIDAFAVDGWGIQTATSVVVAGGIATASFASDHAAAPHAVVLVAGVTGALAGLNGEQKITAAKANQIRWATSEADGTAVGTITVKMAAAGWNKAFSGTNLASYKSASPQAHGQYLRVSDPVGAPARVIGYENMTAISTGTGPFPTSAQVSGGYYWGKTEMSSGTAPIAWALASDGRFLYVCILGYGNETYPVQGSAYLHFFGDMVPESPSADPFATVLAGSTEADTVGVGAEYIVTAAPDGKVAAPRVAGGVGTSARGGLAPLVTGGGAPILPDALTGSIFTTECYYKDTDDSVPRAKLPGLHRSVQTSAEKLQIPKFGIVGGAGASRAYLYVPGSNALYEETYIRAELIDITGPWR